ncbi:MAG TPA: inositol monophosphatase family protein [Candidatus Dormibacteraeota bacterium]
MCRRPARRALTIEGADRDWLGAFEVVGARVREAIAPLLGTEAGRAEIGIGAGGDRTVELDRLAEEVALAELAGFAAAGHPCSVLSEEVGLVDMGAGSPQVLLDPVDGSLNAKQGLPVAGVMLTLLDGPTVADVRVGWVLNLISGERWCAIRGGGAYRNDRRLSPLAPAGRPGRIGVLGIESSPPDLGTLRPLIERAAKVRMLGSMALSLAHTAAGGIEVFAAPIRARIFDMTAGLLMVGEVGGVMTDLAGAPLQDSVVGLESRTTLLGSANPTLHRLALDALRG